MDEIKKCLEFLGHAQVLEDKKIIDCLTSANLEGSFRRRNKQNIKELKKLLDPKVVEATEKMAAAMFDKFEQMVELNKITSRKNKKTENCH